MTRDGCQLANSAFGILFGGSGKQVNFRKQLLLNQFQTTTDLL